MGSNMEIWKAANVTGEPDGIQYEHLGGSVGLGETDRIQYGYLEGLAGPEVPD